MANFPAGVIYIWSGTNASIPSGWERVTALDGKYPKGTADATDPNTTGGSATHEHTGSTHSHTDSHTHSVTFNAGGGTSVGTGGGSGGSLYNHTHSGTTGGVSGGGLSSVSCTYSAISNDPPYYTVIFITPTSGTPYFPQNGIYLYDKTDSKTGHYLCNGSNSTPNLVDKYLKGASAGADAGSTGGSTTNIHNLTHTHTVASHTHSATTSGGPSGEGERDYDSTQQVGSHTHTISTNSTTASLTGTPQLTTAETVEPAYKKLLTVQNQNTGSVSYRLGMIGMWIGTLEGIPANYVLCDGNNGTQDMRGRYLKSTATTGDIGGTGGSNTHTHASQNHTHTGVAHTHTHPNASHSGSVNDTSNGGYLLHRTDAVHTVTVNPATSTYSNASTSASSSNNEPEYRTVAFIKLKSLSAGGAFLLNML